MANINTISEIFFTSDCHYFHDKILFLGKGRPFGPTVLMQTMFAEFKAAEAAYFVEKGALREGKGTELAVKLAAEAMKDLEAKVKAEAKQWVPEMNECMVTRHNEVVKKGSRVYNHGDFALKCTLEQALGIRRRLNGQHFLVEGNHDSIAKEMAAQGAWLWTEAIKRIDVKIPEKQKIVLCHYAMRTWHGSNKGVWQLYGHSHGQLPELGSLLAFDIGVDSWNYYPVSMEQVIEKMKAKIPAWEAYRSQLKDDGIEMEF